MINLFAIVKCARASGNQLLDIEGRMVMRVRVEILIINLKTGVSSSGVLTLSSIPSPPEIVCKGKPWQQPLCISTGNQFCQNSGLDSCYYSMEACFSTFDKDG